MFPQGSLIERLVAALDPNDSESDHALMFRRQARVPPPAPSDAPTAFVLSLWHPGLGAIRSLGRAGVPVIGLDPTLTLSGSVSRYCTPLKCPDPNTRPELLVEFLLEQASRLEQPGVLSPASDGFVLFMSRHRDALRDHFRFNLPAPDVVEASVSKRKLYELAERVGVAHATTFYPEMLDDVYRIRHELEYPVYIKPYYSHLWRAAFPVAGKGIKALTPDELVAGFERVFAAGIQAMVQQIIQGPASNVRTVRVYIAEDGELLARFITRTHRQWPVEFGVGTMVESDLDENFQEMGIRFFRDIDYRGVGTIEFKRDDRDSVWKVTDLNPRWWGSINLAIASGVDFPLIHYLDMIGQRPEPILTFREGVRWVEGRGDLDSAIELIRAGELSVMDALRQWAGARACSTFALDDPKPFFRKYDYWRRVTDVPRKVAHRSRRS